MITGVDEYVQVESGTMRYISTKIHGVLDYAIGGLLIMLACFPPAASTEGSVAASLVFGMVFILNGLFTDHEMGAVSMLTMPFHLWIDLMAGLHLAAAPWFFNFSHALYLPHLIIGVLVVTVGLTTKKLPSYRPSMKRSRGRPVSQPKGAQ